MEKPMESRWTLDFRSRRETTERDMINRQPGTSFIPSGIVTTVTLYKDGVEQLSATVRKHPNEPHYKVLGQKYALAKALTGSSIPKKERKAIWWVFKYRSAQANQIMGG